MSIERVKTFRDKSHDMRKKIFDRNPVWENEYGDFCPDSQNLVS